MGVQTCALPICLAAELGESRQFRSNEDSEFERVGRDDVRQRQEAALNYLRQVRIDVKARMRVAHHWIAAIEDSRATAFGLFHEALDYSRDRRRAEVAGMNDTSGAPEERRVGKK